MLQMKKNFGMQLFFLLIITQFAVAQTGIVFSETGLKAALEKGKAENKPVMLWCYATWCPHCKVMKETVFPTAQVADYFNKTFVCVAQDMEKGEGPEMNKTIKISSFPTFIFYNTNGETVYRVEGELKQAAFVAEGKTALIPQKQLPYLKKRFEKDMSNSDNCFDYIRALKKGGMNASTVANQYFATQSDQQLLSETNWKIFTNGISDINSRPFQFVIKHQKEYANIVSPERVKRKLDYEVKALLNPLVETTDTLNYPAKRALAAQIHSYSTDSLIFNFDLKLYGFTRNWKMYAETCTQSAEKFSWNNSIQLSDMAANILKNSNDSKALLQAERFAKRATELDPGYDNYILCSRLYKKLNYVADAIKMAKKANELAKKSGWEGVEAEQLLKELNSAKN
jgi:thioredoxin-related protein